MSQPHQPGQQPPGYGPAPGSQPDLGDHHDPYPPPPPHRQPEPARKGHSTTTLGVAIVATALIVALACGMYFALRGDSEKPLPESQKAEESAPQEKEAKAEKPKPKEKAKAKKPKPKPKEDLSKFRRECESGIFVEDCRDVRPEELKACERGYDENASGVDLVCPKGTIGSKQRALELARQHALNVCACRSVKRTPSS